MFSFNKLKSITVLVLGLFVLASCASKNNSKSGQAELYFSAGTQSLMRKEYTDALKNLLKANSLTPNQSEILNNLGMAYYFKGEKELALKTLQQSLKIDENNSDAKTNIASIYFKDKNYDQAEKFYKNVLKDLTFDKQARTYFNLGLLELEARKNLTAAADYFKKSIQEDENYCPSYYHLGLIQYTRKQYNSALVNFKEASFGTCFESPAPHYYQALTLIELRRYDDARLKFSEIDTRFKKSIYAVKARAKNMELNEIETRKSNESHASRNVLESPEF